MELDNQCNSKVGRKEEPSEQGSGELACPAWMEEQREIDMNINR